MVNQYLDFLQAMDQLPKEILDMIIDRVVQIDDLLRCRLVNKTWSIFATQSLKTRQTIQFKTEVQVNTGLSIFESKLPFLDYPFSSIYITVSDTSDEAHFQSTLPLVSFFRRYGSYVLELELELELLHIIPLLLGDTPNLKRLHLSFGSPLTITQGLQLGDLLPAALQKLTTINLIRYKYSNGHVGIDDGQFHFLSALKSAATNLNTLLLTPDATDNYLDFTEFHRILTIFKGTPKIQVLATIKISTTDLLKLQELIFDRLNFTTLKLVFFHNRRGSLSRMDMENSRTLFIRWLETQSTTLKTLSLTVETGQLTLFQLPVLAVLESLQIYTTDNEYDSKIAPFVTFTPQQFPNLKHVDITYDHSHYGIFGNGVEAFETVESLRVSSWESEVTYPWDKIFPNTKYLELQIWEPEMLLFFIEQMSHVTHLTLEFGDVDGEELIDHKNFVRKRCQILDGSFQDDSTRSLSNFKNLETLDIPGNCWFITRTIVQMTMAGNLNPLKRLTFGEVDGVAEVEKRILMAYHQNVKWKK